MAKTKKDFEGLWDMTEKVALPSRESNVQLTQTEQAPDTDTEPTQDNDPEPTQDNPEAAASLLDFRRLYQCMPTHVLLARILLFESFLTIKTRMRHLHNFSKATGSCGMCGPHTTPLNLHQTGHFLRHLVTAHRVQYTKLVFKCLEEEDVPALVAWGA